MTRSGPFVYMRYASAVGLLPWECEMSSSRTAFSIVTSRRSARSLLIRNKQLETSPVVPKMPLVFHQLCKDVMLLSC